MNVFDALAEHATLEFNQARMLPVEAYTSDEVLAVEVERLFGAGWVCVGNIADVPAVGDHVVVELPAERGSRSVLVVRGDDNQLRVFDNVCVHRGSPLVDGCGNAARLTCPYHAWTYRLDGSLIGAPRMRNRSEANGVAFDPTGHRLGELRTEVCHGFVFVNPDGLADPLNSQLTGLAEVIDRYGVERYVPVRTETEIWDTNWKLQAENFMDAYHVFHVHRDSFGAEGDSTDATHVFPGTLAWTHHRVVEAGGRELAAPASSLEGEWRNTIVLAAVFPGLVMQLQPDWLWSLRLTPVGTDQVRIDSRVAVAPESLAALGGERDAWLAELFELLDRVNGEDRAVVERIRSAVDGPQFDRAPLAELERNVFDFDRYVAMRVAPPN